MSVAVNTTTGARTPVRIGICAMSYKAHSPSMRAILKLLKSPEICPPNITIEYIYYHPHFDLPIEQWPSSDLLIAFHSTEYPLEKVKAFIKTFFYTKDLNSSAIKRRFVINDVRMQEVLMHRQLAQGILKGARIAASETITILPDERRAELVVKFDEELGKHLSMHFDIPLVRQDNGYIYKLPNTYLRSEVMQEGDVIRRVRDDKVLIKKPWVEKPTSSENHHIWVYYPHNGLDAPGLMDNGLSGGRKLFRKQDDKSSLYDSDLFDIRKDNDSYSYEPLQQVVGWEDVKVYAVGPSYAHAESRKSPLVDGKVTRDEKGKEVRQVIQLTEEQKMIAEKVSLVFGQFVCGFDLLVTDSNGTQTSTVVDVNGWTFVKGNNDFFVECARRLTALTELVVMPNSLYVSSSHVNIVVMRHADRSPKQKLRINTDMDRVRDAFGDRQVLKEAADIKVLLELLAPEEKHKLNDKISLPSAKILVKSNHLVLKWGGELTHLGRAQSIAVGHELSKHEDLRHSSYYSGHESRVMGTADLVLRSMLKVASLPEGMLKLFTEDVSNDKDAKTQLKPLIPDTLQDSMHRIQQAISRTPAKDIHEQEVVACRESKRQVLERWQALCGHVNISDLYDALKYDLLHHKQWLQELLDPCTFWYELYDQVRDLYLEQIGPFELGADPKAMSRSILSPQILPLLSRCLEESQSLIVFTKEAQMQSVMHLVTGGYANSKWSEMDYASSIRIEVVRGSNGGDDGADAEVRLWKSRGALAICKEEHATCEGDEARLEGECLLETLTLEQLLQRLQ